MKKENMCITAEGFKRNVEVSFIKGHPCINLGKGIFARGIFAKGVQMKESEGISSGLLKVFRTKNNIIGYGVDDELFVPIDEHLSHEIDDEDSKVPIKMQSDSYESVIESFPSLVKLIDNPKMKAIYKETLNAVENKLDSEQGQEDGKGIQASSYPYSDNKTYTDSVPNPQKKKYFNFKKRRFGRGIYAKGVKQNISVEVL